jgi:hypothetical protein
MKKLFLAITIPILVILGTPALIATLMYDGTGEEHMPTYLYTDEYDFNNMIFTELNNSINEVEVGTTDNLVLSIHSDMINRFIYEMVLEENPDYAPGDSCTTDDECYIFAEPLQAEGYNFSFRVVGMWVSFYDGETASDPGRFTFNIYLEVNLNDGATYKTVVELHFLFEDDADYYYLEFDKVQMGRLPVPKSFFVTIMDMIENQGNVNLDEQVGGLPLGTLDLNNLSYTIEKDEILAAMEENANGEADSGAQMMQQLLSIVFDEELVTFDLTDDEFILTAGVSKFRSDDTDIPAYLYDMHDKTVEGTETIIGEYNPELFDPEAHVQTLFTEFIFNNALIGGGFEITEETFNKLIYSGAEGFAETRQTVDIEISDTETKTVEVGLQAIWFEFNADGIFVKALFSIADIDSLLVLKANETSTTTEELVFEFYEINAGKDDGENPGDYLEITDMDAFQAVLSDFEIDFGRFDENGNLILSAAELTALMQDGSAPDAVSVTAIDLVEGAIVLTVTPNAQYQAALDAFQSAMETTLGDPNLLTDIGGVLDTTDGGIEQATYEALQDIQEAINDPLQDVTGDQIEELFTNLEGLDEETQQEFLDTIVNSIDPSTVSGFEDVFGNFGQDEEPTTTE